MSGRAFGASARWVALAVCLAVARPTAGEVPANGTTLVLYDETGPWGWLGELYAIAAGNLASRFGDWTAKPVRSYRTGDLEGVRGIVYVGSTYDEPIPDAFLDDVLTDRRPVLWVGANLWKLAQRSPGFAERYGFGYGGLEKSPVGEVRYKGVSLTRDPTQPSEVVAVRLAEKAPAEALAAAVRADGSTFPWAVRGRNVTYVVENPFDYLSEGDRYLAFCDLLFDLLAPETPERHRALVRIEDVHPRSDPARLRAAADLLAAEGVPFGVGVVPVYVDALRASPDGKKRPQRVRLRDAPQVVAALRYMLQKGGRLVLHGYTHQLGAAKNPYSGRSVDDFEFFRAHVSPEDRVVLDGPVEDDSEAWADDRIRAGLAELAAAGLPAPTIFEFPHYAASGLDALAVAKRFAVAWQRGLYFSGSVAGRPQPSTQRMIGQFFPYVVRDVYGLTILPENVGDYQPKPFNRLLPRDVDVILGNARRARVVRDGYAGFFFHSTFDPAMLKDLVRGIRQLGYRFVAPDPTEQPGRLVSPAAAASDPSP